MLFALRPLRFARRPAPRGAVGATLLTTLLLVSGCEQPDLGKPCPGLLGGAPPSSGSTRTETVATVGQSTCFPCEEMICVATDGKDGYCSKKCRDDSNCPTGFVCQQLQPLGDFAGESFCVWMGCETDEDCGDPHMRCVEVPSSDPAGNLKLCEFTDPVELFGPVEEVTCSDENTN